MVDRAQNDHARGMLLAELIRQAAQGIHVGVGDDGAEHWHARDMQDILHLLAEFRLSALRAQKVKLFIKLLELAFEHFRL